MTAITSKVRKSDLRLGKIIGSILKYAFLFLFTVVALVPFVWMISSSFKTGTTVFTIPMQWIPESFHFENYVGMSATSLEKSALIFFRSSGSASP